MAEQTKNPDNPRGGKGSGERGFAAMDAARQREIASMGGKAAHEQGVAHEFTSAEAREAGRKGGQARGNNSISRDNVTESGDK